MRAAAIPFAITVMSLASAGCECATVSRNQYLATAYAPAPARTSTYRVGGEIAESEPTPRFIVVGHAETGENVPTATTPGTAATPPAVAGVARGAEGLTAERQRSVASVNNEIDALSTRLQQLSTQAKIKGAAGEAALDRHARAFKKTTDQIRTALDNARSADADAWNVAEASIDGLMKQARQSVDDAVRDVEAVPVVK